MAWNTTEPDLGIETPHQVLNPKNIEGNSHLGFLTLSFHTASASGRPQACKKELPVMDISKMKTGLAVYSSGSSLTHRR
jgi:hypothetical protein